MPRQMMSDRSENELPETAEAPCDDEQVGIVAGLYQATRRNVSYQPMFDLVCSGGSNCLFQVLPQRPIGRFVRVLRIEGRLTAQWPLVEEPPRHHRRHRGAE